MGAVSSLELDPERLDISVQESGARMSPAWGLLLCMQLLRPVEWRGSVLLAQVAAEAQEAGWTVDPERLSLRREPSGKWTLRFEAPSGQVRVREGVPLSADEIQAKARLLKELERLLGPFQMEPSSENDRAAAAPPEVRVRARRRLNVTLDAGEEAGMTVGTEVRFEDPRTGTARGRIVQASADSAIARVELNVPIEVGAKVLEDLSTEGPSGFPGRPAGVTELRGSLALLFSSTLELRRPGAMLQLGLLHRFRGPWALALEIDPFFLTSDPRSNPEDPNAPRAVVSGAARGLILWDQPLFGFGVGTGVASFNTVPVGGTNPAPVGVDAVAPQLTSRLRLGAVDGLMLKLTNGISIVEGVQFGDLQAIFQIPFGNGVLGRLEGGGGRTGFTMGAFALRWLLRGTGLSPSWFMTARLGGVTVRWQQRSEPFDRLEFSGAVMGLELARRF